MMPAKRSSRTEELLQQARRRDQEAGEEQRTRIHEARAMSVDKEPFDIVVLSRFYSLRDSLGLGEIDDTMSNADIIEAFEAEYYLKFPDVKTIEEYAHRRKTLDRQDAN